MIIIIIIIITTIIILLLESFSLYFEWQQVSSIF